ncbi:MULTISPECIES: GNAT family N-acetyltransferase [Streptomyces]|uniref:N-acetyltransferase n=1 Tax=Streptomyces spororaveus TaxID=284039 RepID=A0ABQ3TCG7_9ACTN|nr:MULTISPECIES: GNAT family N-acetyltransferase [Streptomyces]MCM9081458.1 GNAT family N-acetyltransferase [Streptomyces spororaveus]MCX5304092.1 GNAT family N-acetyltransferase [Streptomyces sp. NBC_00160]GHI78111.1 N-acetyltransferase [Streptomyces spororaveus]
MTIRALSRPPTDTEIDAWVAVLAAARAADLPQGPPPARTEVAGRLRVTPVRGRAALWAADGGAGVAALLLFTDEANAHTAFLDVLAVHPDARRRGLGRALWEQVRAELLAHGRTSVSTLVDLGGPGQAFAQSLGFVNVLPMAWYEQDVTRRPRAAAGAPHPVAPGYELRAWHGLAPDDWAAPLATAHGAMQDAPVGDVDEKAEPWTPQRLHATQQLILDRGGEITTVAAVTARGEVAAYTELVLPDPAGPRALQYDTVVVPAHRGHGLGRAVKLHMLELARHRYPALRRIATTVADENTPMRAVNESLGYRPARPAAYYQLSL